MHVVYITRYVIRIKKQLHNQIKNYRNRKAIIKIKSNQIGENIEKELDKCQYPETVLTKMLEYSIC